MHTSQPSEVEFSVTGMHCPSCGRRIEATLRTLGVTEAIHVDLATKRVRVSLPVGQRAGVPGADSPSPEQMREAITRAGWPASIVESVPA